MVAAESMASTTTRYVFHTRLTVAVWSRSDSDNVAKRLVS